MESIKLPELRIQQNEQDFRISQVLEWEIRPKVFYDSKVRLIRNSDSEYFSVCHLLPEDAWAG